MSEALDIRAWARENGIDIAERGRIPASVREAYEAQDGEEDPEEDETTVEVAPPAPAPAGVPSAPEATAGGKVPERAPKPPVKEKRGLFGKVKERKAGPRRRVSIENIVSGGWGLAAMAMMRSPNSVPVGRVLQFQAPVAGAIVDEAAKGTILDRVLQPLARAGESGEVVLALVGPPAITAAITAKPELYPALRPMLKMSMISWLRLAGPALKRQQRREAEALAAIGEEELAGIDAMIDSLWADIPAGPVSQQEEEHIRRARGE